MSRKQARSESGARAPQGEMGDVYWEALWLLLYNSTIVGKGESLSPDELREIANVKARGTKISVEVRKALVEHGLVYAKKAAVTARGRRLLRERVRPPTFDEVYAWAERHDSRPAEGWLLALLEGEFTVRQMRAAIRDDRSLEA